jgi:putative hydrolase of the HAD superfamily
MECDLEDRVFQRIYSIFGSHSAYGVFEDALPFVHWAGRHGVACGLLSNADERYGTSRCSGSVTLFWLVGGDYWTTPTFRLFSLRHTLLNGKKSIGDSILPMLGLTHDELPFQCFSKNHGLEKPDPRFFREALLAAEAICSDTSTPLRPSEVLHIGNDYSKVLKERESRACTAYCWTGTMNRAWPRNGNAAVRLC